MQAGQPGLVDIFSGKERCKAILDEVDRMPEKWQKVAELKLIEGRPTSEVCDQLSISEKACYSRVSRIRKYIESLLKREDWPDVYKRQPSTLSGRGTEHFTGVSGLVDRLLVAEYGVRYFSHFQKKMENGDIYEMEYVL